ncbi:MAG: tetratricopeptide repeat-containing sulfotransferase family protein [Gammaproteobacteria bacterium]
MPYSVSQFDLTDMGTSTKNAGEVRREQALRCYRVGFALFKAGKVQEAYKAFAEAVSRDDSLAQAHYQLGQCLWRMEDTQGAAEAFNKAITCDARLSAAYLSLSHLYRGTGRMEEATATLLAMVAARPGELPLHYQAAALLSELGSHEQAALIYEACLRRQPHNARTHLRLGQTYQKLGRFADAEQAFLTAIRQDTNTDAAYWLLANTRRFHAGDQALIERLEATVKQPEISDVTAACLHFGLGKIYDDLASYDRAFEHFHAANVLHHRHMKFDRPAIENFVDASKAVFTPELFQRHRAVPTATGAAPVFVLGMLRSGTTLVERILARHPRVYSVGETEWVDTLAARLTAATGIAYPGCAQRLDVGSTEALAQKFRSLWPAGARIAGRVVDKNPLNFLNLGFIALVFPDARIVHCVRDPMDTCLSVYFQHFAHPRNSYAYDLEDIAFFYRQYAALMAHWRQVLPLSLHEVRYEELAMEPEQAIRALLTAIGLEWDPACLEPHLHTGGISTASLWQARQPFYRSSVRRWRHYERHLTSLRQALDMESAGPED